MRLLCFVFIIALLPNSYANDNGYIIIDAVGEDSRKRQPTWIGLSTALGRRAEHVKTGEAIVAVKPGRYFVHHLDFQKNVSINREGVMGPTKFSFDVKENKITLVGTVQFKQNIGTVGRDNMVLSIVNSEDVILKACENKPVLFDQYPIHWTDPEGVDHQFKVRCETTDEKPAQ